MDKIIKWLKSITEKTSVQADFNITSVVFLTPVVIVLFGYWLPVPLILILIITQALCLALLLTEEKISKNFERKWKEIVKKYF